MGELKPLSPEDIAAALRGIKRPDPATLPHMLFVCTRLYDALAAVARTRSAHAVLEYWAMRATGIGLGIDDDVPPDRFDVLFEDGHRERRSLREPASEESEHG